MEQTRINLTELLGHKNKPTEQLTGNTKITKTEENSSENSSENSEEVSSEKKEESVVNVSEQINIELVPSTEEKKIIKLISSDNVDFVLPYKVAMMFAFIKNMIDVTEENTPINIPNVKSTELKKVIDYVTYYCDKAEDDEKWDEKYFGPLNFQEILDVIMAANFMNNPRLVNRGCKAAANFLKGKSVEELRKILNVKNDFTPEEEEQVRKEAEWLAQ